MMWKDFPCLLLVIFVGVNSRNHDRLRNPRGLWNAYTTTVVETSVVTSLIPSTCVHMEPTLAPCRSVRYLSFPTFIANPFSQNNNLPVEQKTENSVIQTTPLGWGEYLGIYAPTVTVTETKIQTTTMEDPRTIVTFAVKGCRPLKLPKDLNPCPDVSNSPPELKEILPTSTVSAHLDTTSGNSLDSMKKDIVPTSTVSAHLETTATNSLDNVNSLRGVYENNQFHQTAPLSVAAVITPSPEGLEHDTKHVATEKLPDKL